MHRTMIFTLHLEVIYVYNSSQMSQRYASSFGGRFWYFGQTR